MQEDDAPRDRLEKKHSLSIIFGLGPAWRSSYRTWPINSKPLSLPAFAGAGSVFLPQSRQGELAGRGLGWGVLGGSIQPDSVSNRGDEIADPPDCMNRGARTIILKAFPQPVNIDLDGVRSDIVGKAEYLILDGALRHNATA